MKLKIDIATPAEAAAIRESMTDAMAKWLHVRAVFDLEGAFETLAVAGFPQSAIRELAEAAIDRAMALATRH